MNFPQSIARWISTSLAVAAASFLVPGISLIGEEHAWVIVLFMGLVLAVINAVIKPVLQLLALPVTILTLGIFALIVNTAMLYLAASLSDGIFGVGIHIASFGSGFVGSIIISIVTSLVDSILQPGLGSSERPQ